jgi:hypothetical protein
MLVPVHSPCPTPQHLIDHEALPVVIQPEGRSIKEHRPNLGDQTTPKMLSFNHEKWK